MKISLLAMQKTTGKQLPVLIADYSGRVSRYFPFTYKELPVKFPASVPSQVICSKEGEILLGQLDTSDQLWLLDERGDRLTSASFADFLVSRQQENVKHLVFAIGGAYGFSPEVRNRSKGSIRLSDMTFTHQMVRLFFVEQLYRAGTIIRNEPYHHS